MAEHGPKSLPRSRVKPQIWSNKIPNSEVFLAPQQAIEFNRIIKWAVSEKVDLCDFMKVWTQIARAPQILQVYEYLLDIQDETKSYRTVYQIITETGLPEATVYRAIRRLRELGLVACLGYVPKFKGSLGGPRPSIWMAV